MDSALCENIIAVISCSDTSHDEIIRGILSAEKCLEPEQMEKDLGKYPWHIDTKYYTAKAHFVPLKAMNADYTCHFPNIEAIVIHCDINKASNFEEASKWQMFMSECNAEVLLFSCENVSDSQEKEVSRDTVVNWCLKNHFELVELNPVEDEDDFKEIKGYSRIFQALLAHTWPDLVFKEPSSYKPMKQELPSLQSEEKEESTNDACSAKVTDSQNKKDETPEQSRVEKIDSLLNEDKWMFEAVGKEDPGSESFESLFNRILGMKEKAETLQGEERKMYAEKVAIEFWRAIGGDEEEIAGLDSDEN